MAQADESSSITANETASTETTGEQSKERLDEAARAFTSRLGEEASGLGSETKQLAEGFAKDASNAAQTKLSGSKERAARGIGSVAEALRSSGHQLRSEDQEGLPRYMDGAADKLERVSDYLRDTELSEVVRDVESFARREPALFVGGAFALGLMGGRFLKSSQRRSSPSGDTLSSSRTGAPRANSSLSNGAGAEAWQGEQRGPKSGQESSNTGAGVGSSERTLQRGRSRDNGVEHANVSPGVTGQGNV